MPTAANPLFENNLLQFLRTEVEVGITFATSALNSESDEKRQRNTQNARKAYDTVQHFLKDRMPPQTVVQPDLLDRLTTFKNLLLELGEKVED